MRLTPGLRLGPYEVLAVLGTGGMAEVYRARDERLGREVALKVVNESLATTPDLIRRFEQEARLAGSLNHPNLVAVYDVGQHEGAQFLVTELLEGESLRRRLSRGPVPVTTALDWAAQMAHGLAAAHARGIIHRDVKPENVFLTSEGHVKLLDFGIAKLARAPVVGGAHGLMEATETPTGRVTRDGSVVGTPGYMSPEQLRGESVDARSDLFSLGAVIYEMLAGQRPFPGGSPVESGYAILHQDPAPLGDGFPSALVQTVYRCLEKEPGRRFESASDLAFELEMLRTPSSAPGPQVDAAADASSTRSGRRWLALAASLGVLLGVGFVAVLVRTRAPAVSPSHVEQITYRWGTIGAGRFMPDGQVAFSAAFEGNPEELFIRPAGSPAAQPLGIKNSRLLAVSRTGELAVLLDMEPVPVLRRRGTLARLPSVGAAPREVAQDVSYADWSPKGDLAAVLDRTEERTLEFPLGNVLFRTKGWISDPRFSAGGDRIAFIHLLNKMCELTVVDLHGGTRTVGGSWPSIEGLVWGPGDSELWFTAGWLSRDAVFATNFRGATREIYRSLSDLRLDDLAHDGTALLTSQFERADTVLRAEGQRAPVFLSWGDWSWPAAISADGKVVLRANPWRPSEHERPRELAILRKTDGSPAQVLGEFVAADLSLDGRSALVLSHDKDRQLIVVPTGPGQPRPVDLHGLKVKFATARFLPDGFLVLAHTETETGYRYHLLKGDGSAPTRVSDAFFTFPHFIVSPDGQRFATLDKDLHPVVVSLADGKISRIPVDTPGAPRGWAPDGSLWLRLLPLRSLTRAEMHRVDVKSGRVLQMLSLGPDDPTGVGQVGDILVTPDGKGFVFGFQRKLGSLFIVRGLVPPR